MTLKRFVTHIKSNQKETTMADNERKVIVQPNGPYIVQGGIPLVR